MKPVFGVFILFLFSCKKNHNGTDHSKLSITHISGIGELNYDQDRLLSMGNTILLYDNGGVLTGARTEKTDSIVVALQPCCGFDSNWMSLKKEKTRYSYLRNNSLIAGILLDSLVSSSRTIGGPYENPSPFPNETVYTNMPYAEFFYTGMRLDSIEYLFNTGNSQVSKSKFEYNASGDIKKQIDHYFHQQSPGTGFPAIQLVSESVTTYEYDSQNNPWHLLFTKTGVILPGFENNNISVHNPVKSISKFIINNQELTATIFFDYEYNTAGFPTRITSGRGTANERIVDLRYN